MNFNYPKLMVFFREQSLEVFRKYSIPRWAMFVLDNIAVFFTFFLAYFLSFNFAHAEFNFKLVLNHALIVVGIYAFFALIFRSYSGLLRHTTLTDISLIFMVTTISMGVLLILSVFSRRLGWSQNLTIPVSIILIHYVSITVLLFFSRVFVKIVFRFVTNTKRDRKNVLVYGAGELGFVVKRVIMSDPQNGYNVAGFIDESKIFRGKKINGIPVLDPDMLNSGFLKKNKIRTLILAVKDICIEEKSRVIRSAINLDIEVLETPDVDKWLNGQLQANQFQKVKLEDLLGRKPIKLNSENIRKGLNNKTILVTGAAGSIGSEIIRQLTRFNIKKSILVDQAETPLFHLENELREKYNHLNYQSILADTTHYGKMKKIFQEFHPDIVFHAAAYKHLSLMEENPHEALRVNLGSTKVLTELAVKYKTGKFVMISTDKSVNPTSVMGASKRICEKLVQGAAQQNGIKTQFVITRFGNVLGSNGSVIPLFSKQIEMGGPVTVTHPEIIRYFMTIPEACELVLEAGFMGKGGEIFVFDMGEPIKITDLANQMIRLSGLVPGKDIQIVYTGLRPGEKLYEELLSQAETTIPTHHPKIKKAHLETPDDYCNVLSKVDEVLKNLYSLSNQEVINYLTELVPEYKCYNDKHLK